MNKWFYFNLALFLFAIWKVMTNNLHPSILFGFIGLLFILFNWTRHAVFSTLRSSIGRQRKIKYANLSKRVLPFHRWTGTTALLIITIHGILMIKRFGLQWTYIKVLSGLFTFLILTAVVLTGWLRLYWPSGRKRMLHLYLGLTMFFLIVIHLIL